MLNTYLTVLTKPSRESFQAAKLSANTTNTLIALAIAGAISGLLGSISSLVVKALASTISGGDFLGLVISPFTGAIFGLIGFFIFNGILWLIAKVLGGTGDFMTQANLVATYAVPLTIIESVLSLIPILGACLAFVLGIYALYLLTLALVVVHSYTTGRAVATWLIPIGVLFICVVCFTVIGLALLGPQISDMFYQITRGLSP